MKIFILLCLLTVYSVHGMPNLEEDLDPVKKEVSALDVKEEDDDMNVNIREKRDTHFTEPYGDDDNDSDSDSDDDDDDNDDSKKEKREHEKSDLDLNVKLNLNGKVDADIDFDINVNQDDDMKNGQLAPMGSNGDEHCECVKKMKRNAKDLQRELNSLNAAVSELLEDALNSLNGTAVPGVRSSGGTDGLVVQDVKDVAAAIDGTVNDLAKSWSIYCRWVRYYYWFGYYDRYVCSWTLSWGRKKRDAEPMEDSDDGPEPYCIAGDLAKITTDLIEEAAKVIGLREDLELNPELAASVLEILQPIADLLGQHEDFVEKLLESLKEISC